MIHLGSNPNWSGNFFCGFKLSFFLSITDWFKWYCCDSHSRAHWNSQLIVARCEWKDFPPPLICKTVLGVNLDIVLVRIAYIYHCCSCKVFSALRLEAVCNYAGTLSTTYIYREHGLILSTVHGVEASAKFQLILSLGWIFLSLSASLQWIR